MANGGGVMGFGENNGTFGVVKDEPIPVFPGIT